MANPPSLFSLSLALSRALHFETWMFDKRSTEKRPAIRGRKRERGLHLRPFRTFLDRCACSCQKHREASAVMTGASWERGRGAGEMSFRK